MATTAPRAAWATMWRRVHGDGEAHDGERCRAVLSRLLRDVAAFARQQQQRLGGRGQEAALWVRAVAAACDARVNQLQRTASHSSARLGVASAHEVVAEAMVQELLVSLAEIRLAETEALVLDEVENVEALRQLRLTLQCEEAALRRVVRDGAGEDAQLVELQSLLRDEFLQELAETRAHGLADSLHNEASLQFAWETIQEQKQEIVRLRAENEQLRSAPTARVCEEPLHAIQQLQLQLSSHPETRLRLLQEQVSQLEAAMATPNARVRARSDATGSIATVNSSRDDRDDVLSDSLLLPSHLAVSEAAPRECLQCRRHVRALIECQSELKQLRAHGAADQDALVRAEKAHVHMKTEHAALTSALLVAKEKQGELRRLVLEITDEKLKLQRQIESHQRDGDAIAESLRQQIRELEQCRETSTRERLDSLVCQEAMEVELGRLRQSRQELESQCELLTKKVKSLEDTVAIKEVAVAIEGGRSEELLKCLAAKDEELKSATTKLEIARDELREKGELVQRLKQIQIDDKSSKEAVVSEARELRAKLEKFNRAEVESIREASEQAEKISELTLELSRLKSAAQSMSDELCRKDTMIRNQREEAISFRDSARRLQEFIAKLEGHLNQSEELRCAQLRELDRALAKIEDLECQAQAAKAEQCQVYEQCRRVELSLADARAQSTSLQAQLEESGESVRSHVESVKIEHERVLGTNQLQLATLESELSETKTTVLMWMSKYHAAINEKKILEDQMKMLRNETKEIESQFKNDLSDLRDSYRGQAEDRERILMELENALKSIQNLKTERHQLEGVINQSKARETDFERDRAHLRAEINQVLAQRQAVEALVREQLVEIGVLQADKTLLARDLKAEKMSRAELQEKVTQDTSAQQRAIERTKQVVKELIRAHESVILRRVSDSVSIVDSLHNRLGAASRVLKDVALSQRRKKKVSEASKCDCVLSRGEIRIAELVEPKKQNSTTLPECTAVGVQTERLRETTREVESKLTLASEINDHLVGVRLDHVGNGGNVLCRDDTWTMSQRGEQNGDAFAIDIDLPCKIKGSINDKLDDGSNRRRDGSGTSWDEGFEAPYANDASICLERLPRMSTAAVHVEGVRCRDSPSLKRELAAIIRVFEDRWCSEMGLADQMLYTLADRVSSVARTAAQAVATIEATHTSRLNHFQDLNGQDAKNLALSSSFAQLREGHQLPARDYSGNRSIAGREDLTPIWVSVEPAKPRVNDGDRGMRGLRQVSSRAMNQNSNRSTSTVKVTGIRRAEVVVSLKDFVTKRTSRAKNPTTPLIVGRKIEKISRDLLPLRRERPISFDMASPSQSHRSDNEGVVKRVTRLWAQFFMKLKMKNTRFRVVTALRASRDRSKARSRIFQRFAALVVKALSHLNLRTFLGIATTKMLSVKRNAQVLLSSAREQRALMAWKYIVAKFAARRRPIAAIKMAIAELCAYRAMLKSLKVQAVRRLWFAIRWRLEALRERRIATRLLVKSLTLQQTVRKRTCLTHFSPQSNLETGRFTGTHIPASSSVQPTMQECSSTFQRCVDQHAAKSKLSDISTANGGSNNKTCRFSELIDFNSLIRLLVEGRRQIDMWKDAMEKKVGEIQAREIQLKRLEAHCAELQLIVDKFQTKSIRRMDHRNGGKSIQEVDGQRWWIEFDHTVRVTGHPVDLGPKWLALEKERRQLNQRNITMLERVITQLHEAKESRLKLDKRLAHTTRVLEVTQRYYRGSCIENTILRTFFWWRLRTLQGRSGAKDHTSHETCQLDETGR